MSFRKITAIFLFAVLTARVLNVSAFETDQYNLSPVPLADVGDEVTDYVEENLRKAVGKINERIAAHERCVKQNAERTNCDAPEKEKLKLERLRAEDAIVKEVFKPLGGGIPPFTRSGSWMESHRFKCQPARYKTSFGRSIFRRFPSNYWTISETVNLFGVEMGTDKIAHIFQQGYTYHGIYERAVAKGASPREAIKKAVNWGRMTENTYYGTLISGVYSNADLAANFAGLRFYQNLTREIRIGGAAHPPILILKDGFWTVNENINLREALLKPFLTDHLNEALNPSVLIPLFGFRSSARAEVKKYACNDWRKKYPQRRAADFEDLTKSLKLWDGEDYGYKTSDHFITIADTCFGE